MNARERAALSCRVCGVEATHTLYYAGRLLVSTTCENCGATSRYPEPELRAAYLRDLESRLSSKPQRWYERLRDDPLTTLASLPCSLAMLPVKLVREVVTVLSR